MDKTSNKYRTLCIYLALALTTLAVFWQVRNHQFINFDDDLYIVDNPYVKAGLTREGLVWAFTRAHAHNWHPLTSLSHMLDCELYALDPAGHHFTSVLFHIANAMLLFLVLNRMTSSLWPSAFVAAAFALHPLHVESVAWASERKDVLSTFLGMLTLVAYVRYAERPVVGRYLLVVLAFCLGLMAKQMLVTLPFVLLLLDYWPLRRLEFRERGTRNSSQTAVVVSARRCILEKLPLVILSVFAGAMVYLIQQRSGIMKSFYPLAYRLGNAIVTYVVYIVKMLWPSHLAIFYPHLHEDLPGWRIAAAALLLVCITAVVLRKTRRHPYLAVGWLWYLITLLPVVGLVQVGLQAFADRYTYIPLTGLFIIIAWGIPDLLARFRYRKALLSLSAATLLLALGVTARRQVGHWRDNITLYSHAAAVVRNNCWANYNLGRALANQDKLDEAAASFIEALRVRPNFAEAHTDLGAVLLEQGRAEQAITHFNEALRIGPYVPAHVNLGRALLIQGKLDQAAAHFSQALRIRSDYLEARIYLANVLLEKAKLDEAITHFTEVLRTSPDFADAHIKLGIALFRQGRIDEAIKHLTEALRIEPDSADVNSKLGLAFFQQGKLDEAVTHFNESLRIKPDSPTVHCNLGVIFARQRKLDEAVTHFRKALEFEPGYPEAAANLGRALIKQGKLDEAVTHFTETLQLKPDSVGSMDTLAWLLATHRDAEFYNPAEAVRLARRACELTKYEKPQLLNTLAAAYAAAGRFPDAVATAEKALDLAVSSGQNRLAEEIQEHLSLYKESRPYIEKPSDRNASAP